MSGRGSTGAGVRAGAAGGSAARRCWLSRTARPRDWRSASAQSDAAVASWTIASGTRFWAASDSAPLNTVSPLARSAAVAPASIARLIAAAARARSERSRLSSRWATALRAADSAAAGGAADARSRPARVDGRARTGTGGRRADTVSGAAAGLAGATPGVSCGGGAVLRDIPGAPGRQPPDRRGDRYTPEASESPPEARARAGVRQRHRWRMRLRLREHERARGRRDLGHQRRAGARLRQRNHLAAHRIVVP